MGFSAMPLRLRLLNYLQSNNVARYVNSTAHIPPLSKSSVPYVPHVKDRYLSPLRAVFRILRLCAAIALSNRFQ